MAYIGRQLARGENKLFDDISSSFNGSTTVFNLTVSSVATSTATPFQLFVSLGGVMQKPNTDFTTAGNQITFTTAPAAGLSCWIMMQGDTVDQAAIPDSSVTPSKIAGSGDFAFPADVRLKDADGSNYVGFQAPTTVSSNVVWTLPAADTGVSGYVLSSNGSGVLSWVESGDNSSPSFTGDVTLTNDGALVGTSSFNATYTGSVKTYTVTVASKSAAHRYNGSGSGSGYKINGKESPFLTLTPGRTYKFDQADGSNSGHPLRFYLEANKTTAYTTGVTTNGTAGNAGAYTQIVVSDTTPQVLHYQCSAHALMGNAVQANSNVAAAGSLNGSTLASSVTASSLTSVGTLGSLAVTNNVTVGGNFTVSGTTTTINTQTLDVEDKNIVIGKVSTPSDTTADGGGITLKGASDHTFNWINATDAWTSSEHIHLLDNKKLFVGGASGTTDGLEIFHNGTGSYIQDSGTGTLYIGGSEVRITNAAISESIAHFIPDGAVELYHNNAKKIETTATGINVTGAITVGGSPLASGASFSATADGAISTGDPLLLLSNGDVHKPVLISAATGTWADTNVNMNNSNINWGNQLVFANNQTFFFHSTYWSSSSVVNVSVTGTTISTTSASNHGFAANGVYHVPEYGNQKDKIGFSGSYNGTNGQLRVRSATVSGSNLSWGSSDDPRNNLSSSGLYNGGHGLVYAPNVDRWISFWRVSGSSAANSYYQMYEGDLSTPVGNNVEYNNFFTGGADNYGPQQVYTFWNNALQKIVMFGFWSGSSTNGVAYRIGTVSTSSVSWSPNVNGGTGWHTMASWKSAAGILTGAEGFDITYDETQQKYMYVRNLMNQNVAKFGFFEHNSSNGTIVQAGSETNFISSSTNVGYKRKIAYQPSTGKGIMFYKNSADSDQTYFCEWTPNFSNNTFSFGSQTEITSNIMYNYAYDVADIGTGKFAMFGPNSNSNNTDIYGVIKQNASTDLTDNFIGFSDGNYSDNATANVLCVGNVSSNHSSLTPGSKYYVQGDGTIGTTAANPEVLAGTAVNTTTITIKH